MIAARLGPRLDSKVTREITMKLIRMACTPYFRFHDAPVRLANHRAKIGI
jgi:hypothetical protein